MIKHYLYLQNISNHFKQYRSPVDYYYFYILQPSETYIQAHLVKNYSIIYLHHILFQILYFFYNTIEKIKSIQALYKSEKKI